jgi:hypothetical protein
MRRYQPRRNHARLFRNWKKRESWEDDFYGRMMLEDGRSYWVGATVRTAWSGKQYISVYLRPIVSTLKNRSRTW